MPNTPWSVYLEVIKRGVTESFLSAIKVDIGAVAADAVFFVLIVAGLSQILGSYTGRVAMWLCGCALLTFLGLWGIYKLWRKKAAEDAGNVARLLADDAGVRRDPVLSGIRYVLMSRPFIYAYLY